MTVGSILLGDTTLSPALSMLKAMNPLNWRAPMPKNQICPNDQSRLRKTRILYGLVTREFSELLRNKKTKGFILGGCTIPLPTPWWGWQCQKCGWDDYPGKFKDQRAGGKSSWA